MHVCKKFWTKSFTSLKFFFTLTSVCHGRKVGLSPGTQGPSELLGPLRPIPTSRTPRTPRILWDLENLPGITCILLNVMREKDFYGINFLYLRNCNFSIITFSQLSWSVLGQQSLKKFQLIVKINKTKVFYI